MKSDFKRGFFLFYWNVSVNETQEAKQNRDIDIYFQKYLKVYVFGSLFFFFMLNLRASL